MAVRIRLQRHGKKGKPFYHIVAADARSKRDGRYIERLGSYNPNTNPATILLDGDRALNWLQNGAEMSDTARAILSYKGVLYRNHLAKGVKKGALSEEQATKKFEAWLGEKEGKITGKTLSIAESIAKEKAEALAKEKEVNMARIAAQEAAAAPVVEEVEEAPVAEAATEDAEETPAVEATEEAATEATEEETKED